MTDFKDLANSLDEQAKQKAQQDQKAAQTAENVQNTDKIVASVDKNAQSTAEGLKHVKGEVSVTNPTDVSGVIDSIHKLNLTAFMQNEGLPQLANNLSDLSNKTQDLQEKLENEGLKKMSDQLSLVVKKLDEVGKVISKTEVSVDSKLQKTIDNLSKSINAIDFKPAVNVSAPDTKIVTAPVDFKPVISALSKVEKAISSAEAPDNTIDLNPVIDGLSTVQKAIQALRFPATNYVLPFRSIDGKAVQVQLDSSGNLPTAGGGSSGTQYTDAGTPPAHAVAPTLTYDNGGAWKNVDLTHGLPVNIVAGGGTGGGPADVGATTAASETDAARQKVTSALRLLDTSQGAGSQLVAAKGDQTSGLWVNVKAALPAGSNVIGHVISDTGSTTAVTGTVTVDTELPAAALLADGTALPTTPIVGGANMTRNGAGTLDMQRSVVNGTNTSGAGVAAAGIIGQFDDVAPTSITENQFGNVRMSTNRNLYGTIRDAAGNERGVNVTSGNALVVDGSAVTQPVSLTSTTVTGTVAVTESGTWNVGSSTATGSAVPANAFYNGVNAQTALPTAASAGNLTGATADKFGRAVVLPGTVRDLVGTQTTTISASVAETTIVTAAASVFNDLTALVVSNTSATAARLDFRDTTAGSVLFSIYIPAGDVRGISFNRPVPQTTVNTNWTAQSSASVTDLRVYAVFDKNK